MVAQEEEEIEYKRAFPDHYAAFTDILDADGDVLGDPPAAPQPASEEQATEAEAGSAAAHALLQGDLLADIVHEHARYHISFCPFHNLIFLLPPMLSKTPSSREECLKEPYGFCLEALVQEASI